MAEHTYFPRTFGVAPAMSPGAEGPVAVMQMTFLDVGGDVVRILFGLDDWGPFQRAVADHVEFAKEAKAQALAAAAREKILLAPLPLGSQPGQKRKH